MISRAILLLATLLIAAATAFTTTPLSQGRLSVATSRPSFLDTRVYASPEVEEKQEEGVIELAGEEPEAPAAPQAAPFLSQGEIDENTLNPDFTDPKEARVIGYMIISLLPVLFLIPLMLGSRDFIPPDALPPVTM